MNTEQCSNCLIRSDTMQSVTEMKQTTRAKVKEFHGFSFVFDRNSLGAQSVPKTVPSAVALTCTKFSFLLLEIEFLIYNRSLIIQLPQRSASSERAFTNSSAVIYTARLSILGLSGR